MGTLIDVHVLLDGSWAEARHLPGIGREPLEGYAFSRSPGFELWLATERRRLAVSTAGVLDEAALSRLARGDAAEAAQHAQLGSFPRGRRPPGGRWVLRSRSSSPRCSGWSFRL